MITAPRTDRQFSHRLVKLKTLIDKKCTCVLRTACTTTKLQLPWLGKFQSDSCLYFKTDPKLTLGFWEVWSTLDLLRTCFCLCKHDGRLGRNMNVCSHLKFHHCFLHALHIKDHLNKILDWLSEFWFCSSTYCQFPDSFFILEGKNSIRISKITKD